MRTLDFLEPGLDVTFSQGESVDITKPTIVFDVQKKISELMQSGSISPSNVLLISSDHGFSAEGKYPARDVVMKNWAHVHDIFPLPHLVETKLWRSPKEKIGSVAYNLWFAAEGTDCGIHNKHDFLEVHTQLWGTGHMQKFQENDPSTLYEDIRMTPGFTHEPFCDERLVYPWHRYLADTDCVWLAAEYDK